MQEKPFYLLTDTSIFSASALFLRFHELALFQTPKYLSCWLFGFFACIWLLLPINAHAHFYQTVRSLDEFTDISQQMSFTIQLSFQFSLLMASVLGSDSFVSAVLCALH